MVESKGLKMLNFKIQTLAGDWMTAELISIGAIYPDDDVIYICGVPCKLSTLRKYTGVRDVNLKKIYEGDKVKVHWLKFCESESEFEKEGVIKYMADGITAAWFVEFDEIIKVGEYEEKGNELLLQTEHMDGNDIVFELI